MKWSWVLGTVILATTILCEIVVHAQHHQARSINSSSSSSGNGNQSQRNRETSSRTISGGKGNRVQESESGGDDYDSAFDNEPTSGDSTEITFPVDDYYEQRQREEQRQNGGVLVANRNSNTTGVNRWKTIPLNALVKFGTETSLASFFKNYVKNTKVVRDNITSEEYLADTKGEPILDARRDKVVVSSRKPTEIRFQAPLFPVKGRAGGVAFEQSAKATVDQAMTRMGPPRQQKQSLSLPVCSPEITTVPVPLDSLKVDPSMLVIPKCLKIERCGGCCLSDLTVCEPETMEKARYTVTILGYDGDSDGAAPQLQFVNTSTVEIDRHKTCKCKCRTKKEHCKSHFHKYDENQCSCICMNREEHERCLDNPDNRIWDNETCMCTCQDVRVCSSGFYFDMNTCGCRQDEREFEMRQLKAPFNRPRVQIRPLRS